MISYPKSSTIVTGVHFSDGVEGTSGFSIGVSGFTVEAVPPSIPKPEVPGRIGYGQPKRAVTARAVIDTGVSVKVSVYLNEPSSFCSDKR